MKDRLAFKRSGSPDLQTFRRMAVGLMACLLVWCGSAAFGAEPGANTTRFQLVPDIPPVLEADGQHNDPETPIVVPIDYFREGDDFQIKSTAALSGGEAWVKIVHTWIEPITAPDGSAPQVRPDQMILVQIQGHVMVTVPGQDPVAALESQNFPSGATITTGSGSTVAIFIGGINSVRLGSDSETTLSYDVVGPFRVNPSLPPTQRRTTVIRLSAGMAFCKIGYEPQVTQYFEISTPQGSVLASAGDFVASFANNAMEVGLARGSVRVIPVENKEGVVLNATNLTGFQVLRSPEQAGQLAAMTANSRFLEHVLDMIKLINLRVADILTRHDRGDPLTAAEKSYLDKLPNISYLKRVKTISSEADKKKK